MTTKTPLEDRRRALEEEFFRKKDLEALTRLREQEVRERTVAELQEISGIRDEAVIGNLVDAGVNAETLVAFALVPLVAVAWADGSVKPAEKDAVLRAARESGIREGSGAYETLERMLLERPSPELLPAWIDYVSALGAGLNGAERKALAAEINGRAREVAEAAGGFLGLGSISAKEERVLGEVAAALD
jgi:hypothetical protein